MSSFVILFPPVLVGFAFFQLFRRHGVDDYLLWIMVVPTGIVLVSTVALFLFSVNQYYSPIEPPTESEYRVRQRHSG